MTPVSRNELVHLIAGAILVAFVGGCGGGNGAANLTSSEVATSEPTQEATLSFENFQPADAVFGQAGFASSLPNAGGAGANTLQEPTSVAVAPDGRIFIADFFNHRVLGYPGLPDVNGPDAGFVLGQEDFTATAQLGVDPSQFSQPFPRRVSINTAGRTAVTNSQDNRVVIFDGVPVNGLSLPTVVVGQVNFQSDMGACSATSLHQPDGAILTDSGKLIVADSENNRVLIWNEIPSASGIPADLVIGQQNLNTCVSNNDGNGVTGAPAARTLNFPSGLWSDGTRLIVADTLNNRVLVWKALPTNNFQPADIVLGQEDFTRNAANDDNGDGVEDAAPTARTLSRGWGVVSNGSMLAVADVLNSRVLVWNSFPTTNFQAADRVLGQSSFAGKACNDSDGNGTAGPGASAQTLCQPVGVALTGSKLLVADSSNNRVLVFTAK
jgi:hypothetical protein